MKIKGHSSFNVKLELYKNQTVISKSSNDDNFYRLEKQIKKQENFSENYSEKFEIYVPKIIEKMNNKFLMEYIYFSENFIDFAQHGNVKKINWFLKKIILIIEKYLSFCQYDYLDKKILENKINSIEKNLINNQYIDINDSFYKNNLKFLKNNINCLDKVKVPLGLCHGDLTFSNILIDSSEIKIYLIDFLDSFIESPILDIVKIRQDTKYYWICNMYSDFFDKNNIILTLNYLDREIDKYFSKYEFYKKTYVFFEKLNILRVYS